MKSRVAVAVLLIPPLLLAIWGGPDNWLLPFVLVIAVAMSIAVLELYGMLRPYGPFVPAGLITVAAAPMFAWVAFEPGMLVAMMLVLPLTMVFRSLSVARDDPVAAMMTTIAPVLYIAPAAGLAVVLRGSPHGLGLVLITLVGVWVNDSGAYFTGRAIGRTKLAPRISPNKSIEGFVGGVIACIAVVWYSHFLTGDTSADRWLSGSDSIMLGIAIAFATPFGDLFESMIKRAVGVKDSSHLLREHGGMLDRVDSLLIAIPAAYFAAFAAGVL